MPELIDYNTAVVDIISQRAKPGPSTYIGGVVGERPDTKGRKQGKWDSRNSERELFQKLSCYYQITGVERGLSRKRLLEKGGHGLFPSVQHLPYPHS